MLIYFLISFIDSDKQWPKMSYLSWWLNKLTTMVFLFQILLNDKLLQSNDSKDAEKFALDHKIANGENSRDGGNKSCACWPIRDCHSQRPNKIALNQRSLLAANNQLKMILILKSC